MLRLLVEVAGRVSEAHGFKKAKSFVTSYLQNFPHSARWLRFVDELYRHHVDGAPSVEMVRSKFLRGYYSRRLGAPQRLELLTSHYDVVESYFRPAIIHDLLTSRQLPLATLHGKSGEAYALTLCRDDWFRFEGELTVFVRRVADQQMLAALTFSLQFTPRRQIVMRIGSLQGPSCADSKAAIVAATKDLSGARPKALALDAFYALAGALDAVTIEAVNMKNHPLNDANHKVVADNDAFWEELATGRTRGGEYILPVSQPVRCLQDVPAKKRKDWLARQAMKAQIRREAVRNVQSWLRFGMWTMDDEAETYAVAAE